MIYATKFKNETDGKVRLYSDIFGNGWFYLQAGETDIRQTPDNRNIWAPYKEVKFIVKYPEGTTLTKVKKRPKWKDPFENENWVVKFWNGYGLEWEIWTVPGGQNLYLPRGLVVKTQISPGSYLAKYSEIRIDEPVPHRQMMSMQPGIVRVHMKPNIQYIKRPKAELAKLRETREWMEKHFTSGDPDLQPEIPKDI